jgi:L-amino acid N-acyltransferase YncA
LDRIREFESSDIEQVANLHRSVFRLDQTGSLERYYSYFSEQFLARDEDSLPSLVCEAERGRILGFLGVAARHFSFGGRQITAALSSQFVVHPEARGRLTGIHLLREFLGGRQDLSFTDEANETSLKVWVALGGSVSTLQGIHWIVPLRPVQLACHRYAPAWMATALGGTANILDRLVSSLPHSPFRYREARLQAEPLSTEAMLDCLNEITSQCQLRPRYDCASLHALIERAEKTRHGSLRKILLRDQENRLAGWYLYHCEPGGLAEVLQIASREDCHIDVVGHLSSDARAHGALAVVGRLEPGLAEPLAHRFCLLFRRKYAMLVHSRFPEILCAIHSGRAFISRLEGEWCLRFA